MRIHRAIAASVVLCSVVAVPSASAAPAAGLTMVAETSVVIGGGAFTTRLHLDAPVAADEQLMVTGYARLRSRTGFAEVLAGQPGGAIYDTVEAPLSSLTGPDGDVDVTIPIDPTGGASGPFPGFHTYSGSAVYPITFQLGSAEGTPDGPAVTGFLVYSTGPDPEAPPLSVALTVPVDGPADPGATVTALPASASASVADVVGALAAHPGVATTLDVDPDLVARLAAGGTADQQTLDRLADLASSGDDVLAAPYFPLDLGSLAAAGLTGLADDEVAAGDATLARYLLRRPDPAVAVIDGPADPATLSAAASLGAGRFVLPDDDLSPLPPPDLFTTYARPAVLAGRDVPALPVVTTDPQLSALLDAGGDRVVDARDVVAGLALVHLEQPSAVRGVALEVPPGGSVDPVVLGGVLAGLRGDPFAAAVTVDGLFAAVPAGTAPPGRAPVDTRPAVAVPGAAALAASVIGVQGLASMVPGAARLVTVLRRDLLSALSTTVGAAGRSTLVAGVDRAVARAESGITLPGSSSVTITSRRGTIPLTVLSNPSLVVHAELRVASPKLQFLPFGTGAGRCRPTDDGEICPMVLSAEATTVRVPVESRTSGVFGLDVTLGSPDGSVVLATNRDTVRSTAISGVGLVLIVAAGLGLAVWWVRDIRHGRRARQLVDPSTGETPVVPLDPPGSWVDSDPVIAEFFASPPPWESASPASPSGPRRGPNR